MNTPPTDPRLEALWQLAAGELDPREIDALRAQLQGEPALAREAERVAALEHRLRAAPLLELPRGFLERTLGQIRPPIEVPWPRALARAAAAILVFLGSWYAFAGEAPAVAQVTQRPLLAHALPDLSANLESTRASTAQAIQGVGREAGARADGWGALGLGSLLLLAGLWVARRPAAHRTRLPVPEESHARN